MSESMLDDKREISVISYSDNGGRHEIGSFGCTKIEVYGEPGEHCYKPWIAVYYSGELLHRIPASMVQVTYKTRHHDQDPNTYANA